MFFLPASRKIDLAQNFRCSDRCHFVFDADDSALDDHLVLEVRSVVCRRGSALFLVSQRYGFVFEVDLLPYIDFLDLFVASELFIQNGIDRRLYDRAGAFVHLYPLLVEELDDCCLSHF